MVGDEASLTDAIMQITTVAIAHYAIAALRSRSPRVARLFDGTALILLEHRQWRSHTLTKMGVQDDDVMAIARDQGVPSLDKIDTAILERNGQISIIPTK